MRAELAKFLYQRRAFQGEFKRFGSKSGWKDQIKTILLVNVVDVKTECVVADHLWFTCGKRFEALALEEGDLVRFTARVAKYLKGYQGYRYDVDEEGFQEGDYQLSYPNKLEKIKRQKKVECIGIDLAGVPWRETGFAILYADSKATTKVLKSDRWIVRSVKCANPDIISIDAPLSMPLKGKMRYCEKQLVKMGIRVFPCLFTQMAKLTARGIKLAEKLRKLGYLVIESYPHSAQIVLCISKGKKNIQALQDGLVKFGITGDVTKYGITDHELDAITSAIVGKLYLEGKTACIGKEAEGLMVIPKGQPNLENYCEEAT